ncbi:Carboxylesterase [Dictyocaulus viviparus]|uniref:Carboxylesterase n=1 Tax=Dictyocaulus viviparus TaxID=29172 RepID=A0A0D8XBA5_DICVI|nr:Carboxylesterase [Dictyocaulus viviparus]
MISVELHIFFESLCYELRSVNTAWGVVKGELVIPDGNDLAPVAQFLGVPYGVAPSGQFRFNMAISSAKWTHLPKEARKLAPACIQTQLPELSETRAFKQMSAQRFDYVHRLLPKLKLQSEDCLYMNIFVPERLENSHRQSPLPVLVVVHGDEYGWNAGSPYNGSILASHGQIVVVTLNYRLGVFGFLGRCESSSCSGNSGISDLVSALTMLNVILPSFGGDSKAVTLLGWGSGASLVSLLMASPLTQPGRRLFRRAILLDGTALAPWAMAQNPQQYFAQVAENLGCLSRNRSSIFNDNVDAAIRCMQDHSAGNVTKAVQTIEIPTFLSIFAPIVDGQLIPNSPRISFSSQYGSLFREIDLLVGFSSNPAHYLLSNDDLKYGLSKERRQKIFRTLVRNLYEYHRSELLAAIINEYTDWENPRDHPKSMRNGVLAVLNDVLFTAPLIETLRMHSADEVRREANTFMFVFGHETRSWMNEQPNSGLRGSLTGDHIPYIFGYPLISRDKEEKVWQELFKTEISYHFVTLFYQSFITILVILPPYFSFNSLLSFKLYFGFNAEDRGISEVLMHYVANFVKSGDPTKPVLMSKSVPMGDAFHSTAWPQFDQPNREAYLEITDRPRIKNYYRNARVGFWTSLVPELHSSGKEGGKVPEEHHLLPDHFKKDSFFGRVRAFVPYVNHPFPAPPLPPSPPPENIGKITSMKPPVATPSPPSDTVTVANGQYSTMLSVTVAVGCGLLFLNICVFFGLYRQVNCDKNKRSKKKLQLQYQTYASNQAAVPDQYNNLNSPEPLLSASHKTSRSGVSPSCPRHGRSVLPLHSGRGSLASSGNAPTLEEIQV